MHYRVVITPAANGDLLRTFRYIRQHAPDAAREWLAGARQRIQSLEQNPQRAPLAPESFSLGEDIRELLHGKGNRGTYRILFVILEGSVFVLHVRHGAMLPMR